VALQVHDEVAGVGVPDLAGGVEAARHELVACLVECAVGQGLQVAAQSLRVLEVLVLVPLQLVF